MATAIPARPDDTRGSQREADLSACEDLLRKGFRLAHFILHDREMAVEILSNAMSKLRVQCSREKRRFRWREKSLKRKITRIVRSEQDAFQWLICFESTQYELRQEEAGPQSTRDLIVRYVKYLVQITTAMSSFYVSVGLQRLLYNYSTSETQKAYEWVTEHYPGAEEYRTVKGKLMRKIEQRFKEYLATCRTQRGERRFEVLEQQESWKDLVERCLRMLMPWSTSEACRTWATFDAGTSSRPSARQSEDISQDEVETGHCHVFIDPYCFAGLTRQLELDSPWQRLAVPKFWNVREGGQGDGRGANEEKQEITEDEIRKIVSRIAEEDVQRKQVSPRLLRILADGVECARIDVVGPGSERRCEISEGVKLIEIWSVSKDADVLLATHLIDYTEWQGVARARAVVDIGTGRELLLEIDPVSETNREEASIALGLRCRPASWLAAWRESLTMSPMRPYILAGYALVTASLVAIAWIGAVEYRHSLRERQAMIERIRKELAHERDLRASLQQRIDAESGRPLVAYQLIPNEFINRGGQGPKEVIVAVSPQSSLVVLDLLVGDNEGASYRAVLKPASRNMELLTESFLKPQRTNGDIAVSFSLPAAFLADGHRYVVNLYSLKKSGAQEKVDSFTFSVVRK